MSKKIINVGSDPGNQGDGDTLRDAFIKVMSNFDELYTVSPVIDASLADHSDPAVDGTIAKALADTEAAGGGTVVVGPGIYNINSTLIVGKDVVLKGSGRRTTTIRMAGTTDAIRVVGQFSAVESLKVQMTISATTYGITVVSGDVHLKNLAIAGGDMLSWAINVDSSNVVYLSNIRIGGTGNKCTCNGIIFQNTAMLPYNFGDSKLSKIDITLEADSTTGIKFHGPDGSANKINNILCSQVEVIGTGPLGGCVGVHLSNAARIVLLTVDLERLGVGVLEDGGGTGSVSKNNVYIATFVLSSKTGYTTRGTVQERLFIGCDNLIPSGTYDNDTIIPQSLWLKDGKSRIWSSDTHINFDNGVNSNGLQLTFASPTPSIRPSSAAVDARLSLGRANSQGVECLPGLVLPVQSVPPPAPLEGMLVYFSAGVVGPSRGLYQYRLSNWVFIA